MEAASAAATLKFSEEAAPAAPAPALGRPWKVQKRQQQ